MRAPSLGATRPRRGPQEWDSGPFGVMIARRPTGHKRPEGGLRTSTTPSPTPPNMLPRSLDELAIRLDRHTAGQVHDDIVLVRQARGVLPETVVVAICPRGKYRVPERIE